MRKILLTALVISAMAPSIWAVSVTTYNTPDITAIFGSGNPNTGWAVNTAGEIQLGLRGKNRDDGSTPNNGAGTYSFPTGFSTTSPTRALWNWEFSINSDNVNPVTANLPTYDYYLAIDIDPSGGITFVVVNPLTAFGDNAYGNNGTANGAGTVGLASVLAAGNNIAQNSENIVFQGLNPLADATYDYRLYAVASGTGAGGTPLADVAITVVVGSGGAAAAVPDAGSTMALLGLGMAGLAGFRFWKRTV